MNSRQRRRLEAQRHNDAVDYERWLINKTKDQQRAKSSRLQRASDRATMLMSALAISGVMVLGDD